MCTRSIESEGSYTCVLGVSKVRVIYMCIRSIESEGSYTCVLGVEKVRSHIHVY